MSLSVTLAADVLVAILLVATIATSVRLSARITRLKADETAMRQTIGDLLSASDKAERAIAGLRAALGECDRGLSERIDAADRAAVSLAGQVEAGEGVLARIAAIVAQAGTKPAGRAAPAAASTRELVPAPPAAPVSNGQRLDVARAAAQAMSERALDRLRARAA